MKLLGIYSYKDEKSQVFDTPFFCLNDQMAERKFVMDVRNPNSLISQFTDDFKLIKIGIFDVETGLIGDLGQAVIIDGKSYKKDEEKKL